MRNKNNKSLTNHLPFPTTLIERRIHIIRGQEVMLDSDLAELYQVLTKNLNKAVARNRNRFPADFMFQLTPQETKNLRFQFGTSSLTSQIAMPSSGYGGRRYLPYAFTEHGVAMLSSVLSSERAIAMNIFIIRAFIQIRKMLATHKELAKRLQKVERTQKLHGYLLTGMARDISRLKNPPKTNAIGFIWKN